MPLVLAIACALGTVYAVAWSMCSAAKRADEDAERARHPYQRWCERCGMLTEHQGARCVNERLHGINVNCATWRRNPTTGQYEADPHTMRVLEGNL